ncbi:hypothetical protein [Winogradskyella sediminis]|uniref:Uncharacterized protein n=1 Tax=Winogradskyella sediminis TaxID=1382466 RepID=A0A1H1P253_9FLAO|nr:hypothetical protein [Winogradskyella sediminis]REG90180.1 hypothetical protein C8N41_1011430 [Winogradskyella sediminis]SDS05263.1 hypothetical protein SAMN04489797_0756 [Winogradskyella sediminis]
MRTIPFVNFRILKQCICIVCLSTLFACPSDDDCTKTITIPQTYFVGNQSYIQEITQEIPCDQQEPSEPGEIIEPPVLENFTYEILSFNYEPYTDNNTTLVQYEIQLNNHNDFAVTGIPYLTRIDGNFEVSGPISTDASEPCYEISANSSCVLSFNQEYTIDPNIPPSSTFQIVNVEYVVIN